MKRLIPAAALAAAILAVFPFVPAGAQQGTTRKAAFAPDGAVPPPEPVHHSKSSTATLRGGRMPMAMAPSSARVLGVTVPAAVPAGQPFQASVTVQNAGPDTWVPGPTGYKLGALNDTGTWGISRAELAAAVPPGGTATFQITATAPAAGGVASFQWRMLKEGAYWFGDITQAAINVTGGAAPPPPPANNFQQDQNLASGAIAMPGDNDPTSATIIVSPAVLVDGKVHQIRWTNPLASTVWISRSLSWDGFDMGLTCDGDSSVIRDRDGSVLSHNQSDHYSPMSFAAGNCISMIYPAPMMLKPGETLTMTYFANPITGRGNHQHNICIWIQNTPK